MRGFPGVRLTRRLALAGAVTLVAAGLTAAVMRPASAATAAALDRRPACVVTVAQLSGEQREQLRARGIPFVVFDPSSELPDGVPFVGATNWSGGRAATRHLTELG